MLDDYDSASSASFEDIEPQAPYSAYHDADVAHWNSLVPFRDNDDETPVKAYEGGVVPEVCYVVQHRGFANKLLDEQRSKEPIIVERKSGDNQEKTGEKPVLEIVTTVSHIFPILSNKSHHRGPPPPGPHPPIPYGRRPGAPPPPMPGTAPPHHHPPGSEPPVWKETSMLINSSHLINALRAVVGYYPDFQCDGKTIKVSAPYQVLVQHRAELDGYKRNQPSTHDDEYATITAHHIDILLEFLHKTLGEELREEGALQKRSIPSATFENLWMLFKPGEIAYVKHQRTWTPFVISSSSSGYKTKGRYAPNQFSVVCWNIASLESADPGDRSGRQMYVFHINPFSGEQAIASLDVIPARFFRGENGNMDPADVAAKQIKLGKIAWDLTTKGPTYMSYEGALARKYLRPDEDADISPIGYMSGRVIVDCKGYMKYRFFNHRGPGMPPPPGMHYRSVPRQQVHRDHLPYFAPRCRCVSCSKSEDEDSAGPFAEFLDRDASESSAPKSDLYYMVLSNIVSGFILSDRSWGHFDVEYLHDIKFETDSFKSLVLDDEVKTTVKSLVGKFANSKGQVSPWPKDFVKNKGMGRIFLLHGSPGVGKTCTAEAAAELTQRPLISLTSGDLSTAMHTVEHSLGHFLKLGERFGAIVLLDEADVYLERRRAIDIQRNGLVSVFLRALEYYRGVLFLTTNRVQTVDPAFASRIHVALHYKALTDANREKIWLNSFERLERDSGGKVHVSVATREYAYQSKDIQDLRWNGREIRNALQTAVSLAETESIEDGADTVTVSDKHLRSVVKMSRSFKTYMTRRGVYDESEEDEEDEDVDDGQESIIYED